MIDLAEVCATVDAIRASGDHEAAHVVCDRLHRDVLAAVADGHPDAVEMARETLRLDARMPA